MSRINKSQYAILGLLNKRPLSGYDIKQIFNRFSQFHWSESNAQIYPMLKCLENQGMVTSKLDLKSGARKRRIYRITKQGVKHLNEWLEKSPEPTKYREEILLKLSNSQHLPKEVTQQHLKEYQHHLLDLQKSLKSVNEHIQVDHAGRVDQKNLLLTYRYSEFVIEAKLKWCREALKEVHEK